MKIEESLMVEYQEYLLGISTEKLTPKKQEILDRVTEAWSMWMKCKTKSKTVELMSNSGKWPSKSSAYSDLRIAERLLGDVEFQAKAISRIIATNMALEIYEVARKSKDVANMNRAHGNYIKANALQTDDPDMPDWEKLKMPQNIIKVDVNFLNDKRFENIDPNIREQLMNELSKVNIPQTLDITPKERESDL